MRTTNIKMGTNESALSSVPRCRIRPISSDQRASKGISVSIVAGFCSSLRGERTKYDLATVQYTDELIPRSFIVVDLHEFYDITPGEQIRFGRKARRAYLARRT